MSKRIDRVEVRGRIEPRRDPHWQRLAQGRYVGFRRMAPGTPGTWLARFYDGEAYHQQPLGDFALLPEKDRFDAATRAAEAWFAQCEGATPKAVTVAEACRQYTEDRRARKGELSAKDAEGRFKRHVYDAKIGKLELAKLKAADIEKWLHGLIRRDDDDPDAERRSKDSANRDLSSFKAVLNFSFRAGLVASDAQWRRVKSFENVARRRERFLKLGERKRLYAAATPELKRLIKAIALTGARPGEIAGARIGDFDSKAGTLALSGKTGRRTIPVSQEAATFFKTQASGKEADALLIVRDNATAWNRFAWRDAMQQAVTVARLPDDVVLYSMRHAAISEMLTAGIDPLAVARMTGTGLAMISKHYGHLVQDHVREQLAEVKVL